MTDAHALLARIADRRPKIIDLGLERMRAALERLDNPQLRAPPVFHVAGTNGKGSTVAFIRAILEAAESSVHVFTSPHLVRFNERIVLAGEEISDAKLIDVVTRVDEAVGDDALTFFETITCAAFLAFAETRADFLVLEVGLGGRLDSTNVLEKPLASVIAPIALDHQKFLGESLAEVAGEKAGIFRASAPAVIGQQAPEAMAALEERAATVGAHVFSYGSDWDVRLEHGRLVYQGTDGLSDLAKPRLPGAHQTMNAGLAIAAVRAAGLAVDDAALSAGLENARWPARIQRLKAGPLIDLARTILGQEPEVWLDGGHNPHAGRAVAAAMADMEERASKPLVLITGMQANKDADGYFAAFADMALAVFGVAADHQGAAAPSVIVEAAERAGIFAQVCPSLKEAMRRACLEAEDAPRILICGSLYLAGEVLAEHV
ncbi:MAG: bifunctional folylpolyglutamate synthase/dihydrofolate synthase [Parvularculaceae bacterium]